MGLPVLADEVVLDEVVPEEDDPQAASTGPESRTAPEANRNLRRVSDSCSCSRLTPITGPFSGGQMVYIQTQPIVEPILLLGLGGCQGFANTEETLALEPIVT